MVSDMKLWIYYILWLLACAIMGWIGTLMLNLNYYQSFSLSAAALIVGAFFSQKEDRRSGEFVRSDIVLPESEEDKKE